MAEASTIVASAVILPETEQPQSSSPRTLKRRQSSFSDDHSKRARLSHVESNGGTDLAASPSTDRPVDRAPERRKIGQLEERKRGQRLFGALLGTLSQSSSSTASNRRSEIEKKQQAKLKLQTEEENEKKRHRREALNAIRQEEQVKYDKQSMHIRHSNMLAQAHFLHTKAEPKVYFKPWELLPSQEERIKAQVEDAEETIDKDRDQWDKEHPASQRQERKEEKTDSPRIRGPISSNSDGDTVGFPEEKEKPSSPSPDEDTNMNGAPPPENQLKVTEPPEGPKDHVDDGGEVVEGEEDTVIY